MAATYGVKRRTSFRAPWAFLRLRHAIIGAVLVSVALSEIAIIGPAMVLWKTAEVDRLEAEALQLVKANVDLSTTPSVTDTLRLTQRLIPISPVRGGTVLNTLGEELGRFGNAPTLTFAAVRAADDRRAFSENGTNLDILLPIEMTGLPYMLVVRVDASAIPRLVWERVTDRSIVVLGVALVSGLIVAAILSIAVVRPMLRLRDAAMAAADSPARAQHFRLRWTRSDELGDAARALDLLLTAVSMVHQEDLAAIQEALQRSSHAVLSYDPAGRIATANPAALRLFGVRSLEGLIGMPAAFVRTPDGPAAVSPVELLAQGDADGIVTVRTADGTRVCHLSGATIRRANGSVLRHLVTLVDLSAPYAAMDQLRAERESLAQDVAEQRRRAARFRLTFEGCLALMQAYPPPQPGDLPVQEAGSILAAWKGRAQRDGLIASLEHGDLLPVRGDSEAVATVFRQALLAVTLRSPHRRPRLVVQSSPVGDGVGRFDVAEASGAGQPAAGGDGDAGSAVALKALSRALARAGGAMLAAPPDRNAVSFILRAAAAEQPQQRDTTRAA